MVLLPPSISWPNTRTVIPLLAVVVVLSMWMRFQHDALVDDERATESSQAESSWPDMRIRVNSASAAELSLLPGVGPRLAQRIVEDRAANGAFVQLADLQRVPGIGAATIERMSGFVRLDESKLANQSPAE